MYSGHELVDYYYSQLLNKFYFNTGVRLRVMIPRFVNNILNYICRDRFNKQINISLTRLQRGLFNNEWLILFFHSNQNE